MSCHLLTPWWEPRVPRQVDADDVIGSTAATVLLDWRSPAVANFAATVAEQDSAVLMLRRAHFEVAGSVQASYGLRDEQPASVTVRRGRGSCSQRLAVVEAIARANGVPTRTHGLLVAGNFWQLRFPRLKWLLPNAVVLAWPEVMIAGQWAPLAQVLRPPLPAGKSFANVGSETLFDAMTDADLRWDCNDTCQDPTHTALGGFLIRDLGRYQSRDELFARHGQTLCWPARTIADPIMSQLSFRRQAS